jgi:heat shock protein HspQ
MRFRAVRALRSLHANAPMGDATRDVLINILLSSDNSALRIEALQALTEHPSPSQAAPDYLYQARNDSNSYVRYQAEQALQSLQTASLDAPIE